jgi:hypothetical protein
MPRDHPRAAKRQGETEEDSQYEIWMSELFDALLDRHPRIGCGVFAAVGGSQLGHLFRRVRTECCRRQHGYERNNGNGGYDGQRSSRMAPSSRAKKMCRH